MDIEQMAKEIRLFTKDKDIKITANDKIIDFNEREPEINHYLNGFLIIDYPNVDGRYL
jgi:hypothetical protein